MIDPLARLSANILRVMRSAGQPERITADVNEVAATGPHETDSLTSWRDAYGDSNESTVESFEFGICDAALRLVAGRLDGNRTEVNKASRDISRVLADRDKFLRDQDAAHLTEIANDNASIKTDAAAVGKFPKKKSKGGKAECLVYFIYDGVGAFKIGKSSTPARRMADLQTAHPRRLDLVATMPGGAYMEGKLHEKFSKRRLSGEWFEDCPEIRAYLGIAEIAQPNAVNDNVAAHVFPFSPMALAGR